MFADLMMATDEQLHAGHWRCDDRQLCLGAVDRVRRSRSILEIDYTEDRLGGVQMLP